VPKPKVIEDYYGRQLEAEPVMASVGPMVDLDYHFSAAIDPADREGFFRLTPEQARNLSTQLKEAADEVDPEVAA